MTVAGRRIAKRRVVTSGCWSARPTRMPTTSIQRFSRTIGTGISRLSIADMIYSDIFTPGIGLRVRSAPPGGMPLHGYVLGDAAVPTDVEVDIAADSWMHGRGLVQI